MATPSTVFTELVTTTLRNSGTEVTDMGYDLRLAPTEIHRVLTDPLTHQPLAQPHRIWKGWIDGAPRVTPPKGLNGGRITLQVASASMALTRTLTAKYSDEAMRLRAGDRLFRYADVSGKVPIFWGEKKVVSGGGGAPSTAAKPAPLPRPKGSER